MAITTTIERVYNSIGFLKTINNGIKEKQEKKIDNIIYKSTDKKAPL